jgi:NTE family protein
LNEQRSLVLSGGGAPGAAWMAGMMEGLRGAGVDLGEADLIVGTSAGAIAGAQLAGGVLDRVVAMYRADAFPRVKVSVTTDEFMAAAVRAGAQASDGDDAIRRIANLEPLGGELTSEDELRVLFEALVPVNAWPQRRLLVTAVDAESGRRVGFEAGSGVELLDAVRASCAVPGTFPLVTIDGRRYADGGLRSAYNADLAAGSRVVAILSPLRSDPYLDGLLKTEIAALGRATVLLVAADESSLEAIGPNLATQATVRAAFEAGMEQAAGERDVLGSSWH